MDCVRSDDLHQQASTVDNVLVLGLDMDACFACDFFLSGLEARHDFTKKCLQRILQLVRVEDYDVLVLRLATNRRDAESDVRNAAYHGTKPAVEVLCYVADMIRLLLGDSPIRLELDKRLLVEQFFPSRAHTEAQGYADTEAQGYADAVDALLREGETPLLSDEDRYAEPPFFVKEASESQHKLDVCLSLAWQYQGDHPVTVVLIDDRLSGIDMLEGTCLRPLMRFMTDNPQYLPDNVRFTFLKMDPYTLRCKLEQTFHETNTYLSDCIASMDQKELGILLANALRWAREQDYDLPEIPYWDSRTAITTYLEYTYGRGQSVALRAQSKSLKNMMFAWVVMDHSERKADYFQQLIDARFAVLDRYSELRLQRYRERMIDIVHQVQGCASMRLSVCEPVFWQEMLVPMARHYREFLLSYQDDIETNLSDASLSDEDTERRFADLDSADEGTGFSFYNRAEKFYSR